MLRKRLEVEDLTPADVQRLVTQAVGEAVGPLQQTVQKHRLLSMCWEAPACSNVTPASASRSE